MKPTEMLGVILRRAELTPRERESFEDMFDRLNRFKRCSDRQKAWIEKVFYDQKLDREATPMRRRVIIPTWQKGETGLRRAPPQSPPALVKAVGTTVERPETRHVLVKNRPKTGTFLASPSAPPKAHQIGKINYPGVQREVLVTSLSTFEEICPRIKPGSKQHRKIAEFFASGGIVLKVKPLATAQVA
jgi:hypothetical protein